MLGLLNIFDLFAIAGLVILVLLFIGTILGFFDWRL